jgi:hypothetical protein
MGRPGWSELPVRARLFRVAHLVWGVLNLAALGHVWVSAIAGVRTRALAGAVGLLSLEGLALLAGRGNCLFGQFQRSLGDPVPMFELFLPRRAAKAAIPALTFVSLAGLAALIIRRLACVRKAVETDSTPRFAQKGRRRYAGGRFRWDRARPSGGVCP